MAVTVGTMNVKGKLDSKDMDRGFKRIQSGFKEVSKFGKSVTADLTRMVSASGRLLSIFTGLGVAGAGTFLNLAKGAPAVAPAMAQITIETERLKRALGVSLAPVFDKFAEGYRKFVRFIEDNPDLTRGFVLSAGAVAGIGAMSKLLGALGVTLVSASTLTALGYLAVIGAGGFGGFKIAESLVGKLNTAMGLTGENVPAGVSMTAGGWVDRLISTVSASVTGKPAPWEDPLGVGPGADRARQARVEQGFQPTPGGMISSMPEEDRRFFLLQWWDALWS